MFLFLLFLTLVIGVHCLFSLVSLSRGLLILLIFSEKQLLVSLIFSIDFLFSMVLISALIFIFYFLLTLLLICSSCSSFLRQKQIIGFISFFFSLIYIQYYKFPSEHCFCYIPHVFISCVYIFVCSKYLKISLEISSLNCMLLSILVFPVIYFSILVFPVIFMLLIYFSIILVFPVIFLILISSLILVFQYFHIFQYFQLYF